MKHITRSYDSQTPAKAFVGLLFPNWETQTNGQPGTFPTSFPSPSSSSSSSSSSSFSSLLYFINILICFAINISIFIDIVLQYYPLPQNITIPNVSTMADKVSNRQLQHQHQHQQPVTSGQPRRRVGPGPSRRRRQIARQALQRGQEDVPPQRENQLDPSGENGADQQKGH
ncbi:hypothetical protein DPV78_006831 [Talaromyces pinophilus]|nr:hypothetical protein DPV78_006831 [Talaromyces pinophilus]